GWGRDGLGTGARERGARARRVLMSTRAPTSGTLARGALPALQQILGRPTLAMTMRYVHLNPKHLREEMAKTERQAEPQTSHRAESAEGSTQEITHEAGSRGGV